jgi:hypothetical protein
MKKTSILLMFAAIAIFTTAFLQAPKPKIFPELEKFYSTLNTASLNPEHAVALADLKNYIIRGIGSDYKIDIAFTDNDNSFTSVSAQIVLQSLLSVNKYNKLVVHSAGFKSNEISPLLIKVLSKHGYVVAEVANAVNGKKAYEIKFGENMPSLTIYSKQVAEESLPVTNLLQVKNCAVNDNSCSDIKTAIFKLNLPFASPGTTTTEDEADKVFTTIATEIVSSFNKAKE